MLVILRGYRGEVTHILGVSFSFEHLRVALQYHEGEEGGPVVRTELHHQLQGEHGAAIVGGSIRELRAFLKHHNHWSTIDADYKCMLKLDVCDITSCSKLFSLADKVDSFLSKSLDDFPDFEDGQTELTTSKHLAVNEYS